MSFMRNRNKNLMVLVVFLSLTGTIRAQDSWKDILDTAATRARQVSLYRREINWDSLHRAMHALADKAQSLDDIKPALQAMINGLRDMHGKVLVAGTYEQIAGFTDWAHVRNPDTRPRETLAWNVINDSSMRFSYQLLDKKIAYLKIAGIPPNADPLAEAKKIRAGVVALSQSDPSGWIVDLRYNGGGNMNPMVSGLATLIGDGPAGKLVDLDMAEVFDWRIAEGQFVFGGATNTRLANEPMFKGHPKVAVLLSRYTVSSGELLATSFKGRPQTKFFGEASGGYTTSNGWEVINNKIILAISTAIYADRNGNAYPFSIPVDVECPLQLPGDVKDDQCIQLASGWLLQ